VGWGGVGLGGWDWVKIKELEGLTFEVRKMGASSTRNAVFLAEELWLWWVGGWVGVWGGMGEEVGVRGEESGLDFYQEILSPREGGYDSLFRSNIS